MLFTEYAHLLLSLWNLQFILMNSSIVLNNFSLKSDSSCKDQGFTFIIFPHKTIVQKSMTQMPDLRQTEIETC